MRTTQILTYFQFGCPLSTNFRTKFSCSVMILRKNTKNTMLYVKVIPGKTVDVELFFPDFYLADRICEMGLLTT